MAKKTRVISIASVLLWLVCITTQETQQQAKCESLKKQLFECESSSEVTGTLKIFISGQDIIKP